VNHYTLHPTHAPDPCPHCGHEIAGYHAHSACPGLQEGNSHLCFVVTVSELGVKRCGNVRTHSLSYRMGRRGARLYEAVPARRHDDAPIYCAEHATQLAIKLTIESRHERAA